MIFATGDLHGKFDRIEDFCNRFSVEGTMILLGDVGLNYYLDKGKKDIKNKQRLNILPLTFICVHGNHEERPENLDTYELLTIDKKGKFFYEMEFPNILFMIDGESYNLENKSFLCLGGAYSVDKYYRLQRGWNWFESEQMNEDVKQNIRMSRFGNDFDVILSHTCPQKYVPTETFLMQVDQSTVDHSMEQFLDECERNINYSQWYCGHFHTDKSDGNIKFFLSTRTHL